MTQPETPKNRRSLSADKIVSRALELADEAGYETLSMRKLAGSLGATAMSLYNHVAGKDELLDLMLARVVAEIESPVVGGEWEEMMGIHAVDLENLRW